MKNRSFALGLLVVLALFAAACSGGDDPEGPNDDAAPAGTDAPEPVPTGGATEPGATAPTETDTAATAAEQVTDTIQVGSTNFTEQELVAEMYALALEDADYSVERRFQLGQREIVFPALQNGEIDVYPEYVGTMLEFLNGGAGTATSDTEETLGLLEEQLSDEPIEVLEPAEAQDKNGLVVTQETAQEYGLETVSDLQDVAGELTLGGPPECPQRPLCLPGYQDVYGLEFGEFVSLDAGGTLTQSALSNGDIDVALMFTTQGVINANDWVLLEDDQGLQPAENLVPAIREDSLDPTIRETLNSVSAALTTDQLTQLNRRVDVDEEPIPAVAESFLTEEGVIGG
jgi:osmoprotectant transport system substrate-binding protein